MNMPTPIHIVSIRRTIIFAIAATLLVSLLPFSSSKAIDDPILLPCDRALLIGHRGTTIGVARNNSLVAFQRAVADGAEVLEMDIHRTKPINGSGTWVVWHDKTIQGKKITDYTYSQLKAIQPDLLTIREAFIYVSTTGRTMQVEVKPTAAGEGSFKYFAQLVNEYGMYSKFELASFDTTNLARAKAQGLKTVYLANTPVTPAAVRRYATIVHFNKTLVVSRAFVENYHRAGIKVYAYTMNTASDWTKYLGYGVDGITTDLSANYVAYCNALQV